MFQNEYRLVMQHTTHQIGRDYSNVETVRYVLQTKPMGLGIWKTLPVVLFENLTEAERQELLKAVFLGNPNQA
jgi:hypothetical protein